VLDTATILSPHFSQRQPFFLAKAADQGASVQFAGRSALFLD
jgi:hypothetical protein